MKKWGVTILVVVVVAIAIIIVATRKKEPTAVKFGYQPVASNYPFFVALEKGFFEDEGLRVKPVKFQSSNTAAEAMVTGRIVSDASTTMTVLLGIEARSPGQLKAYAFQTHTKTDFLESIIVRKGAGIRSLSDLKGKKIGIFPGSFNKKITELVLKDFLDPEEDVTLVPMAPPLQLQALSSGQVDALVSYEPTTSIALEKGLAEVLEHAPWEKHVMDPFPAVAYCLPTKFIETNPDVARRIVRAMYKAIDYIRNHPVEAARTIPKYTPVERNLAAKLNQPLQQKADEVDRDAVQKVSDLLYSAGILEKKVETRNIYYEAE